MNGRFLGVVLILGLTCVGGCSRDADQPPAAPPPAGAPAAHPDTAYSGFLEAVNDTQIVGWAWDRNRPDEAVTVNILDGKRLLESVKADGLRRDLVDAKCGTGKYGFLVSMPASMKDGQLHEIHAVVADTNFELEHSPKPYQLIPKKTAGKP